MATEPAPRVEQRQLLRWVALGQEHPFSDINDHPTPVIVATRKGSPSAVPP